MGKKFCLHDEHSCTPFFPGPTDTWKSCSMWIFYLLYSLLVHEFTVSVLIDTNYIMPARTCMGVIIPIVNVF